MALMLGIVLFAAFWLAFNIQIKVKNLNYTPKRESINF